MTDSPARDALEREVSGYLPMLSADELRVLSVQMRRMIRIGRDKYGPLDLSKEKRDWRAEMASESSDRLFYEACAEVARTERRRERLQRFIDCATDTDADFEDEKPTNQFRLDVSNSSPAESALCAVCGLSEDTGAHWWPKWQHGAHEYESRQGGEIVNAPGTKPGVPREHVAGASPAPDTSGQSCPNSPATNAGSAGEDFSAASASASSATTLLGESVLPQSGEAEVASFCAACGALIVEPIDHWPGCSRLLRDIESEVL